MKTLHSIIGKIVLLLYFLLLYQIWSLCQYGGLRSHLPLLLLSAAGCLACVMIRRLSRNKGKAEERPDRKKPRLKAEMIIALLITCCFAGGIVYSAIPYNGALSWKIAELQNEKKIKASGMNLFQDGIDGVFANLSDALKLPEELYIADSFEMTFTADGEIQKLDTFLYGKDAKGKTRTYLISYDRTKDSEITVWLDGEANPDYSDDKRLEPMIQILDKVDYQEKVGAWSRQYASERYEILYYGRRSFSSDEGLTFVSGDRDALFQLRNGGEVSGCEVSLYMPDREDVIPVRYIADPEYVSQETLDNERKTLQDAEAKQDDSWTTDSADGSMRFFLNDSLGWRLLEADAAAGSRFYEMEQTRDGGASWEKLNADPFNGNGGTAEGIRFFDENFGFAGLAGASQSQSTLYVTRDGGAAFAAIQLPLDSVTELPPLAKSLHLTAADYAYCEMPRKADDGTLTIRAMTGAGEQEAILFESKDNGATWAYAGVDTEE